VFLEGSVRNVLIFRPKQLHLFIQENSLSIVKSNANLADDTCVTPLFIFYILSRSICRV
jgi:hypothetical protein